jgi:hypothetical protein
MRTQGALLRRAQPGSHRSLRQHIRRAQRLHDLIAERFGIRESYQYRAEASTLRPGAVRWTGGQHTV